MSFDLNEFINDNSDKPIRIQFGKSVVYRSGDSKKPVSKLTEEQNDFVNTALSGGFTKGKQVTASFSIQVDGELFVAVKRGKVPDLSGLSVNNLKRGAEPQAQEEVQEIQSAQPENEPEKNSEPQAQEEVQSEQLEQSENVPERSAEPQAEILASETVAEKFESIGYLVKMKTMVQSHLLDSIGSLETEVEQQQEQEELGSAITVHLGRGAIPAAVAEYDQKIEYLYTDIDQIHQTNLVDSGQLAAIASNYGVELAGELSVVEEGFESKSIDVRAIEIRDSPFPLLEDINPAAIAQPGELSIAAETVGLVDLAEAVPENQHDWLVQKVQGFKESGIAQTLLNKGVEVAQDGLKKAGELAQSTREKGLADSVVALVDEFGDHFEGDGKADSSSLACLETEGFSIVKLRAEDGKDQYSVASSGRSAIFRYGSKRESPVFERNDLGVGQQFEILAAGAAVTRDRAHEKSKIVYATAKESAQNVLTKAHQIGEKAGEDLATTYKATKKVVDTLGNLAPVGAKKAVGKMQAQVVESVAQSLTRHEKAVHSAGKTVFEGASLTFTRASTEVGQQLDVATKEGRKLFLVTREAIEDGVAHTAQSSTEKIKQFNVKVQSKFSSKGIDKLILKSQSLGLKIGKLGIGKLGLNLSDKKQKKSNKNRRENVKGVER